MSHRIVTSLAVLILMSGCQMLEYKGQARDVKKRSGQGGVLALPLNPRAEDQKVAEERMRAACGSQTYRVLEEGEVVIGTKSTQSARATMRDDTRRNEGQFLGMQLTSGEAGGTDTQTTSSTESVKEWQITYECVTQKPVQGARR